MKRYLIPPILIVILVLASGLMLSCGHEVEDKPSLTEKEIIQLLHDYDIDMADQWQGLEGYLRKAEIGSSWEGTIMTAESETLREQLRQVKERQLPSIENVEIQFWSASLNTHSRTVQVETLKKFANYSGDGWWHVSIFDWEWMVNEKTGEIKTWNDERGEFLQEVTPLKTYYNSKHNYSIDYRPGWTVNDDEKDGVVIFGPDSKGSILIRGKGSILIGVFEKLPNDSGELEEEASLASYVLAKAIWLEGYWQEFEITGSERGYPVWRVDYTYIGFDGERQECKHYFISHEDKFYEVVSPAVLFDTALSGLYPPHLSSDLYDGYKTFRFEP